MNRKDFLAQVGVGAAALIVPLCLGGLSSCKKTTTTPAATPTQTPTPTVDFTLDISSGALSANGGYLVHSGVIVARTNAGNFIAVSSACTHQGTNVQYDAANNYIVCPNHGAQFNLSGVVTLGPANKNLTQYNTQLTGNSLHVYA
jgi:cytochrome b6-f complex iron-sulfur subunit